MTINSLYQGPTLVYERQRDGHFALSQFLKSSHAAVKAHFGSSLAMSRVGFVVGAPDEPPDSASSPTGAAYVFERVSGSFQETSRLIYSDSIANGDDGMATLGVTIGEGVIAVSALDRSAAVGIDDPSTATLPIAGAIYLYERGTNGWAFTHRLKSLYHGMVPDSFGESPQLAQGTLVVGQPNDSSGSAGVGANYADESALLSGAAWIFE